jgi:hypothetical protein
VRPPFFVVLGKYHVSDLRYATKLMLTFHEFVYHDFEVFVLEENPFLSWLCWESQ